ncbi:PE family protein, partial [Mycobacterium tuberculosis]
MSRQASRQVSIIRSAGDGNRSCGCVTP